MAKPRRERFWWVEVSDPNGCTFRIEIEREQMTPAHSDLSDRVSALMGAFVRRGVKPAGEATHGE